MEEMTKEQLEIIKSGLELLKDEKIKLKDSWNLLNFEKVKLLFESEEIFQNYKNDIIENLIKDINIINHIFAKYYDELPF